MWLQLVRVLMRKVNQESGKEWRSGDVEDFIILLESPKMRWHLIRNWSEVREEIMGRTATKDHLWKVQCGQNIASMWTTEVRLEGWAAAVGKKREFHLKCSRILSWRMTFLKDPSSCCMEDGLQKVEVERRLVWRLVQIKDGGLDLD